MTAQLPTPEALALSANIFTSQIASWIPASFAPAVPTQQAESDWQTIIQSAGAGVSEGKDRLGLGHPLLTAPKAAGYGQGIKGLEKSLKKGKMAEQQRESERDKSGGPAQRPGWQPRADDSESEGESRSSMVGKKRKGGMVDLLAGKGKKKAKANGGNGAAEGQIHPRHLASVAAKEQEAAAGQSVDASELDADIRPVSTSTSRVDYHPTDAVNTPNEHQPIASAVNAPVGQPNTSQSTISASTKSTPSSPTNSLQATSTPSTHPLLLQHDSKLSKNARKKARQRAKKAAALNGET